MMSGGTERIVPDGSLDTLGLLCPAPIIETAERLAEMQGGQILEVLSDDRGVIYDMPAWCKLSGNRLLSMEDNGNQVTLYVQKRK